MKLTRLNPDRVTRRVLTVRDEDGKRMRVVLHFRVVNGAGSGGAGWGGWQMAAAPVGTLRSKLRWRKMSAVLWDAFALQVGGERQLEFSEISK